jgi:TM2 domain-containing membrane protein YozV
MEIILWILAAVLVLSGIKKMFNGEVLLGVVFIVVGLLVGPGGTSLFV